MSNHTHVAGVPASVDKDDAFVESTVRYIAYSLVAIVLIVGLLISMALLVSPAEKENPDQAAQAVAQRIAKVGKVTVQDNTPREPRSGEQVFTAQCGTCHVSGALGAPKLGDKAAWSSRIGSGFTALLNSALRGKNSMPAQGGGQYSDLEVARGVVYMANGSGAKFAEPADGVKPAK